ncbi:YveK family protein [Metabacillus arenae]|uniref:Capsular biosynthesis protein n=1 Tax=Metabacillus arenae TaxID=2771434 RepID=A0A926RZC6_9BACI|nr:Wzz/FepE/Etk N-terminal domain-containing protein [Metabacillus arenae]MBD1382670.1 capsular biosynthesis protein [Metabacillus arenae]
MEETISLKELFQTLRKRLALIVMITAIATMASGIVSYFLITPIYQSSTQILVNQSNSEQLLNNPGQIQSNLQLINTYNVIIKSPAILELVIEELKLEESVGALNEKITVSSENESQVVNIRVEDEDPQKAANIANTTATVFEAQVKEIMNIDNVKVLSEAQLGENPSPIEPKPVLNMAIAFVVGLMAGVGLAFLLEYLDTTIKDEQEIENLLELPVLGTITEFNQENNQGKQAQSAKKGTVRGESFGA